MSVIRNLNEDPEKWQPGGFPLVTMMNVEVRHGKNKPVIKKALVEVIYHGKNKYGKINLFPPSSLANKHMNMGNKI